MKQSAGPPDVLSTDELREALRLSPVERARLVRAAQRLADGTDYEPDDLLGEAVVRALDGTRSCPRTVAPRTFLYNAMKSIASAAWETRQLRPHLVGIDDQKERDAVAALRSPSRSAEEKLIADEDVSARRDALMVLFDTDADALCVVMGNLDGLSPDDIRGVCELDTVAYATVRRRIRRTVQQEFPQGWPS